MPRLDGDRHPAPPPTRLLAGADTGNGTAYDNADYGEALVLAHGNATHLPNADNPFFDPDTFYSMHTGQERTSCSATARCISSPAASTLSLTNACAPSPAAKSAND